MRLVRSISDIEHSIIMECRILAAHQEREKGRHYDVLYVLWYFSLLYLPPKTSSGLFLMHCSDSNRPVQRRSIDEQDNSWVNSSIDPGKFNVEVSYGCVQSF